MPMPNIKTPANKVIFALFFKIYRSAANGKGKWRWGNAEKFQCRELHLCTAQSL